MRILGISSATPIISIGLVDGEKIMVETTVPGIQAEMVIHYIKEAGIEPEQIEGIAVAAGPGSYSGLRGGLAAAKSLAQTLNVPLAGTSTLEAIAYNLVDAEGAIAVILDARADEYNFALFGACGGKLRRLTADLVLKADSLAAKLAKISGELWLVGRTGDFLRRKELSGNNFHFASETNSHPLGINVARLGAIRIMKGQIDDPLKLTPRYSHMPNIKEYN